MHGNGAYDLSGFSSGDTNGQDPWDDGTDPPLLEGATGGDCLVWVGQVLDVAEGCQQATDTDGDYEFGGCVTAEDGGTEDVTDAQSNLDGIDVSASPTDEVTYDEGGSVGDFLTSAGDSTLSLDLDGAQTPVDQGELDDSLTGPISFDVSDNAALRRPGERSPAVTVAGKAVVGGLPISGKLTVNPQASKSSPAGTAAVTVGTVLPAVLGGGAATMTATTTVNRGITGIKVTAARASFLRLFQLSNVVLSYGPGTDGGASWHVTATASSGGASGTQLDRHPGLRRRRRPRLGVPVDRRHHPGRPGQHHQARHHRQGRGLGGDGRHRHRQIRDDRSHHPGLRRHRASLRVDQGH